MALNLVSPSENTSLVVAETVHTTGGSSDSIDPGFSKQNGLPAAAIAEFRSTNGGVLLPRQTSAQIAAIVANPNVSLIDGTVIYNTDTQSLVIAAGVAPGFSALPLTATYSLTNAQLLALNATPVLVLPAPGAGFMLVIHRVVAEYVFQTASFVVPGGSNITFTIGGVTVATAMAATGFLDQGASQIMISPASTVTATAKTTLTNAGLSVTNTVGALTNNVGGTSTVTINVTYSIVAV